VATTSPLQTLPIPSASDSPDGPSQIVAVTKAIEQQLVLRFSSAADRTAKFSAAGISPADRMICYRADATAPNYFEYYNLAAGQWRVLGQFRLNPTALSAPAGSVTFSNIPSYLRELRITVTARGDAVAAAVDLGVQVNGNTGIAYRWQERYIQNSATAQTTGTLNDTRIRCGTMAGANSGTSTAFGASTIEVVGWDNPHASYLTVKGSGGYVDTSGYVIADFQGAASVTGPYTSLTVVPFTGNFVAGSEFSLVGWE
jgi:hypothetical protein